MTVDEDTLLAQEFARLIAQFWRVSGRRGSFQGLKQSEFMLLVTLIHLVDNEVNGVKVSDISTRLQITSAAVTQMLNTLEQKGYVQRLADPSDGRVVLLMPTSEGRNLFKAANEKHIEHLKGLIDFLGEKDSRELIRLMSLVLDFAKQSRNATAQDQ